MDAPTNQLPATSYSVDSKGNLIKKAYRSSKITDYFIGSVKGVKLKSDGEPALCTFK